MILTKQFLNEKVKTRILDENLKFQKRQELDAYDVFISYSWNDRSFAYKVVELLENCGYTVYVDYNDLKLDRSKVDEETAKRLVEKMKKCKGLLYLYSPSSSVSKWCPWEVGVFSGIKNFRCANLPIIDKTTDEYKNQEYLELYPYVEYEQVQGKDNYDFWICETDDKYVKLRQWINGEKPYIHK